MICNNAFVLESHLIDWFPAFLVFLKINLPVPVKIMLSDCLQIFINVSRNVSQSNLVYFPHRMLFIRQFQLSYWNKAVLVPEIFVKIKSFFRYKFHLSKVLKTSSLMIGRLIKSSILIFPVLDLGRCSQALATWDKLINREQRQ